MTTFFHDLRYAARSLRRTPAFTAVAVATLALGIGANTAIFSVLRGVLLRPLPFHEPARLMMVWESNAARGNTKNVVAPPNYLAWKEQSRSFEKLAAFTPFAANLAGNGEPQRVQVGYVSAEFFETLGARTISGRLLDSRDVQENSPETIVISSALWRERFGADPGVVGRDVRVNGTASKIVGVAEQSFDFPPGVDVWVPYALGEKQRQAKGRWLGVVGRLKPGRTLGGAQAEMSGIALRLARENPELDKGWGVTVVPLREQIVGDVRIGLLVLMGAVSGVLLIACGNLANLLVARGTLRRRELALRSALGASRGRLMRGMLTESVLISCAGGIAGAVLGRLGVKALLALAPLEIPNFVRIEVDGAVVAFTAAISIAVGFAFGLFPAFDVGRAKSGEILREAGAGTAAGSRRRTVFQRWLVAAQVALSLTLLVGAGLLLRSLQSLGNVDPGFRTGSVMSFQVTLPSRGYEKPEQVANFFATAEERLRALPGVENVGSVSWLPLGGPGAATGFHRTDRPVPETAEQPVADIRVVTPGFFSTLSLPVEAGRTFDTRDSSRAPFRVVVNESLARENFPDRNPIGSTLSVAWAAAGGVTAEVIGVVKDARLDSLEAAPRATIYFSQDQSSNNFMAILLRGSSNLASLGPSVRRTIRSIDPEIPAARFEAMDRVLDGSLKRPRFLSVLCGAFALLALLLAALGVYGVVNYAVTQRTREIGIRVALGGRRSDIFRLVLGSGLAPVVPGAMAGLLGAFAIGRFERSLLFGVAPADFLTLLGVSALLFAVALLACAIPASRATAVDPMTALRCE